jgi:hypothetical protein
MDIGLLRSKLPECPFAHLPDKKSGGPGAGLPAAKMKECRWLKPILVGQFEFVEGSSDLHVRHTRFMGLWEGKRAKGVGARSCKNRMSN